MLLRPTAAMILATVTASSSLLRGAASRSGSTGGVFAVAAFATGSGRPIEWMGRCRFSSAKYRSIVGSHRRRRGVSFFGGKKGSGGTALTPSSNVAFGPLRGGDMVGLGSTAEAQATPNTTGGGTNDDSDEEEYERDIAQAASSARDIAGIVRPATFAGIPYVDTTPLDVPYLDPNSSDKQGRSRRRHRVLFVLGGPGAGKGTQSERIVGTYKCVHLSAGELLRTRGPASKHAPLIEDCLVHGKIVPVEISLGLLRDAMDESDDSPCDDDGQKYGARIFLVDGFPRNFDNLDGWCRIMAHKSSESSSNDVESPASCLGALVYDCPVSVLEARILSRAETSGRSDDNLESARKRFKTFESQTVPVVRALERVEATEKAETSSSRVHVSRIRGDGSVDDVWATTKRAMDGYVKNDVLSANRRLLDAVREGDWETYGDVIDESLFASVMEAEKTSPRKEEGKKVGGGGADGGVSRSSEEDRLRRFFDTYEVGEAGIGAYGELANGTVEIYDGTRAVLSYDRLPVADDIESAAPPMRETRVWSHGERGWVCVHFFRTPL